MAKTPSGKNDTPPEETGEKPFEACLAELEEIVRQLEAGSRPLDQSLELYERGVAALKRCHAMLDKAEKRIRTLVKGPDGEPLVREAELPRRGKESARRQQGEARASAEELAESQDSEEQGIDGEEESSQNPAPSTPPKSPTGGGKPPAGGSLFGHQK